MRTFLSTAALIAVASPVFAQEFTGGELGFEYNQLLDDGEIDGTNYYAGAEVAFSRDFSVGVNAANLDFTGEDTRATLHGIYHLNDAVSLGVFVAGGDNDTTSLGVEGGMELFGGDIGGYIGQISVEDEDAFTIGLSSNTPIGANFTFFTDFDIVADEQVAVSTNEIGIEYNIANGPDLYAQYGRINLDTTTGDGSTDFFGVGARIEFGAGRGTTFEAR